MSIRVLITRDFDQMSEQAAVMVGQGIAEEVAGKGGCVVGLATGASPRGMYKHLAKAANNGLFDPGSVRTFNLDEYVGLPGENAQMRALHPESYSHFMVRELFGLMSKRFIETNVPGGCLIEGGELEAALGANPGDWEEEGRGLGKAVVIRRDAADGYLRWIRREILDGYREKIRRYGGIDLQVVGVGEGGHVGFHEAGIPFRGNEMLLVKLDRGTVENAVMDGHFRSFGESPRYAVSMGAELVYQAKRVFLLAFGARKAGAVAASLVGAPRAEVPISYGRALSDRGGEMVYIIDEAAAGGVLAERGAIEGGGVCIEDVRGVPLMRRVDQVMFRWDAGGGCMV